ncbi:cupin domain-containing protein [Microtetraspora sp. AC03309]|uniref:cupin domain-containing protein n=1 Tax=Microtetraspora sp. AC03309 TaxID=2779376 RepID=UPI001E4DDC85|nr:cupin domain-containing protein [Microtetraspora sp. AC03309]MCC5578839.1 cupin domain-containing protein [Microtetraspora sp. AC03309]
MTGLPAGGAFPGGVGVSDLRVYDWPAADGRRGGSPHVHLLCSEAYVVVEGKGSVQTITCQGFAETPLAPGTVVSFTPGTVHRLVNDGGLRIVVVMQNSGLPEAGDAVLTFPAAVVSDPEAYGAAAAVSGEESARRRRDLAMEGFLELRERSRSGPSCVEDFLRHAVRIVAGRLDAFEERWRSGALAAVRATGAQFARLRAGDIGHLRDAGVTRTGAEPRLGMCGRLDAFSTGRS